MNYHNFCGKIIYSQLASFVFPNDIIGIQVITLEFPDNDPNHKSWLMVVQTMEQWMEQLMVHDECDGLTIVG
jgi:hypothetical protein